LIRRQKLIFARNLLYNGASTGGVGKHRSMFEGHPGKVDRTSRRKRFWVFVAAGHESFEFSGCHGDQ
jgi:hypothetical protein